MSHRALCLEGMRCKQAIIDYKTNQIRTFLFHFTLTLLHESSFMLGTLFTAARVNLNCRLMVEVMSFFSSRRHPVNISGNKFSCFRCDIVQVHTNRQEAPCNLIYGDLRRRLRVPGYYHQVLNDRGFSATGVPLNGLYFRDKVDRLDLHVLPSLSNS